MPYTYDYPRPALTVDCLLWGYTPQQPLQVLLIQRAKPPFQHHWALPGGFVDEMEDLQAAALRELKEETGITLQKMEQIAAFGKPGRDPRGHVVSIAHGALIAPQQHPLQAADDARNVRWFSIVELPDLAFDHADIIASGLHHLKNKLQFKPVGLDLLPPAFSRRDWIALNEKLCQSAGLTTENLPEQFAHWKKLGIFLPVSTKEQEAKFQVGWNKYAVLFKQLPGLPSDENPS